MEGVTLVLILIIILAWAYDFFNGMNDAANAIATTICTRALSPYQAIALARALNFLGAFLSTEVAKTIGKIVTPAYATPGVIISGLIGANAWSWLCTYAGIPISITHSLIAGLMGAAFAAGGLHAVQWHAVGNKIFIGLIVSPVAGFFIGFLLMLAMMWIFQNGTPSRLNLLFRRGQILSAGYMAYAHGLNDTQNAMGVITTALVSAGILKDFVVPFWVKVASAFFMALGTSVGGWRVIKTLGMRLVHIQPVQGFSAEAGAGTTILVTSLVGMPISTTHAIATAVMGSGAVRRFSAVRWGIGTHIIFTWIFTFPGAAVIAAVALTLLHLFGVK